MAGRLVLAADPDPVDRSLLGARDLPRAQVLWRREHEWRGRGSGEAVFAERYARGEISEEDYRQRLAVLRERP